MKEVESICDSSSHILINKGAPFIFLTPEHPSIRLRALKIKALKPSEFSQVQSHQDHPSDSSFKALKNIQASSSSSSTNRGGDFTVRSEIKLSSPRFNI